MTRIAWLAEVGRWLEIAFIAAGITGIAALIWVAGGPVAGIVAGMALAALWLMT